MSPRRAKVMDREGRCDAGMKARTVRQKRGGVGELRRQEVWYRRRAWRVARRQDSRAREAALKK